MIKQKMVLLLKFSQLMHPIRFYCFTILILLFFACKTEKEPALREEQKSKIKYAQGFYIEDHEGYKKLVITSPYPGAKYPLEYLLAPIGTDVPVGISGDRLIRTPVKNIVVTSTTHIPMLELLGEEPSLTGFPNLDYISSVRTRERIENGKITELGKGENLNMELLLEIQPEVVISFSMNSNNKMHTAIEKAGIPVLSNGDWLEKTPLGRAEWIKFFAVLYQKEALADSIFDHIEHQYKDAITIAKKAKDKPSVLSGVMFKDIWNLPGGESFVAQFLKDANTAYLWSDTMGKGSLALNFESVFTKAENADFWIAPGHYKSREELQNANEHYTEFNAFKSYKIYTYANKTGKNGGVLYYERAPVQPHIVLKDIIKITHPELLPDYEPFFFEKLN